ncbi:hypothetical protein NN561_001264 [Cricetulus griseus]
MQLSVNLYFFLSSLFTTRVEDDKDTLGMDLLSSGPSSELGGKSRNIDENSAKGGSGNSRANPLGASLYAARPGAELEALHPGTPRQHPRVGYSSPQSTPQWLTLPGRGPGSSSLRACLFSSTKRALQFSHQTPRSEPGEEPPPLPEPGDPVPKPGEPPRDPGELVPMPGDAGPGEPVKELGDEVPEPGDGVPDEPSAEPAPSGVGRLPVRDSSYALRYQLSGEKGAAGLVGEHTSFTCRRDTWRQALRGHRSPSGTAWRAGAAVLPALLRTCLPRKSIPQVT